MPIHPIIKARVDAWLEQGPRDVQDRPTWFALHHNQFIENKLGLARGSLLGYYQDQDRIVMAARHALELLVARMQPVTDEQAEAWVAYSREYSHQPPRYEEVSGQTDLRRRNAIVRREIRANHQAPRDPSPIPVPEMTAADWGTDVTSQIRAITSENRARSRSRGRRAAPSDARSAASLNRTQEGRIQRQQQQGSPVRRSARLNTNAE